MKSDEEWKKQLSPEAYHVTREKGTERPYSGQYDNFDEEGVFTCICCGEKLFLSDHKFNAGCGWPSFDRPTDQETIKTQADHSLARERTEVLCKNCDAHLGHVFPDGPTETGQRYCINSVALNFEPGTKKRD